MEPILIKCDNCNGEGLISTGANKIDLRHGSTLVCPVCTGKGKVDQNAPAAASEEGPKAEESSQSAPGGSDSSDSEAGAAVTPQIGDSCLTTDSQPGKLAKDDEGNWVCVAL